MFAALHQDLNEFSNNLMKKALEQLNNGCSVVPTKKPRLPACLSEDSSCQPLPKRLKVGDLHGVKRDIQSEESGSESSNAPSTSNQSSTGETLKIIPSNRKKKKKSDGHQGSSDAFVWKIVNGRPVPETSLMRPPVKLVLKL